MICIKAVLDVIQQAIDVSQSRLIDAKKSESGSNAKKGELFKPSRPRRDISHKTLEIHRPGARIIQRTRRGRRARPTVASTIISFCNWCKRFTVSRR
ncbi:hypothetical protein EVAR_17074_1 [Eumeta japonica]|uniref:Uncharacterized protein n=1 Tax=Eumeta variegata TaxID=151549 RepID=A0A4C1V5U7_EUMVA|nr:hypothetical protein EVAR_17074_1 [Eumeta japonica]